MIFGNSNNPLSEGNIAYHIGIYGQSNAEGNAQNERLANTQYNYKGIAAGYPTVRSAQAQYGKTPSGVYVYNKPGADQNSDFVVDNMQWEAYNADTNARFDGLDRFGCELSLGTQVIDGGLNEIFFTKAAFGGTGLIPGSSTNRPGTWNFNSRVVAVQYILKRAIRDLKTYRSGKRIKPLCKIWWQGESDGLSFQTKADYKANLALCLDYIDKGYRESLVLEHDVPWFFIIPSYNRDAAEQQIRDAITEYVAEHSNCYAFNVDAYPRKMDLSANEASPLTKGVPNAAGGNDDQHQSYIAQLATGELLHNKLVQLGLL